MNHQERLKRATLANIQWIDGERKTHFVEEWNHTKAIIKAYLGDRVLYEVCPDCNGHGVICMRDSTPSLNEYEQECIRCKAFDGFIQVWPKEES